MKEIDARGIACPGPVLQTKAALEEDKATRLRVSVDNQAAQQNILRYLESNGFETTTEAQGKDFVIMGKGEGPMDTTPPPPRQSTVSQHRILVFAGTDRIGFGDDGLGQSLMTSIISLP